MKHTKIGRRVKEIDDTIEALRQEKKALQERCTHTQVKRELVSNYDYKEPLEELHEYYSVTCLNCQKCYTEPKMRRRGMLM